MSHKRRTKNQQNVTDVFCKLQEDGLIYANSRDMARGKNANIAVASLPGRVPFAFFWNDRMKIAKRLDPIGLKDTFLNLRFFNSVGEIPHFRSSGHGSKVRNYLM